MSTKHIRIIKKLDDILGSLLEKTKILCSNVNLFGGSISNASLYGIYIPMPTNFKLNVAIKNHEIECIEEERVYRDDTLKYSKGINENIKKLGGQVSSILRDGLANHVKNGDEYNFPDPHDRPLIMSAPWADGYKKNYWTLNVFDIVSIYDRVALLGKPGTGKSTALKYLASTLIENILTNEQMTSVDVLSDKLFAENYIPIYIEFRKLANWWNEEVEATRIGNEERINLGLITRYLYSQAGISYINGTRLPSQNKYIFMFDGIDEIPQGINNIDHAFSQSALNYLVGEIARTYGGENKEVKILFSSRIDEFNSYSFNNFEVAELVSMNEYIAIDLIDRIKTLCNDECTDPRGLLAELKEKGFGDDIVFNPMLLSLLSFVAIDKGKGKLPDNKCEVLRESIELLLKRWATKGENKPAFFSQFEQEGNLYGQAIFKELEKFAYESEENGQISIAVLYSFMRREQSNANSIMDYLSKTAGLIVEDTELSAKFAHKSFRSYLAASYICNQANVVELLLKEVDKSIAIGGINETLTLAVEILLDDNSQGYTLESFVSQSLDKYSDYDLCVWFIGKIVSGREGKFYKERIIHNTYITTKLLEKLGSVFHESNQIPPNKRIECGYFLGQLGDQREGIGNTEANLSDIVWCPVNKCELEFGLTKVARDMVSKTPWGADIDFSRECTKKGETIKMDIDEFEISKYPVTVAQFTAFLQDNDGYKNKRWYTWSGASLDYYNGVVIKTIPKENATDYYFDFYLPKLFRIPNLPITHVPFFVAIAFCKWLTEKMNDGTEVRLPTEMEWETAVKMRGGQVYEWGDDGVNSDWQDQFVTNNCNCLGTKIYRVCPVGSFNDTKERTPVDLTGNVWEWTSSYFTDTLGIVSVNTTINTIENKHLTTDNAKNLLITARGGSLHNGLNGLRVSFRGRDPILADAADRHSFRVVRTKPRTISYYEERKLAKGNNKNGVAEGYGLPVNRGDKITIMYRISRNKELIQPQSDFTFVLGDGIVHQALEKEIMNNHRRACNFTKHYLGKDLFNASGFKNIIAPNDELEVFIHIKDTMEIN